MPRAGKSAKLPLTGSAVKATAFQGSVGSAVVETANRNRLLTALSSAKSTIAANQRREAGSKTKRGSLTSTPGGNVTPALIQKARSLMVCKGVKFVLLNTA